MKESPWFLFAVWTVSPPRQPVICGGLCALNHEPQKSEVVGPLLLEH